MKRITACLAVLLVSPLQPLLAAYQNYPMAIRQLIIENGIRRYESSSISSCFRVEIVSDTEGLKTESFRRGRPFVTARPEERYAVRLYNPLPVRVAVNLTVDGLNSLTGKPSGIADGAKWIIEPHAFITIRGWQVNGGEARRFFFTDKSKSYGKWRGDQIGKDLSANCGVIGAAYFWSRKELDAYYEAHPIYRNPEPAPFSQPQGAERAMSLRGRASLLHKAVPAEDRQEAGTGMGEREVNPTQWVHFDYDQGMYRLSQAVVLYYDFAEAPRPNPFPALSFAPEMP